MHVRCPHCHNPIELVEDAELADIECPSCGSSFSLVGDETIAYRKSGDGAAAPSRTIAHFELREQVGVGAFGSVWKAKDTKLDRTVAVKIPRKGQLDTAEAEQFISEARSAAQLKHPNIVTVHEVGVDEGQTYIVSDFIDGQPLSTWLSDRQLTFREAAELCVKIAKALHHAHEAGVIHRDLKPANIMLDGEGEPHIMDFGLAKRDAVEITMTVDGKVLGTPAYMSPEQARGEAHAADRRTDLYSLGVILFETLTGEKPFRGDYRTLLHQVINEEAEGPRILKATVPRDLDTVCLKCLEKQPDQRYPTALDFANELVRFLRGEPIQARPISTAAQIWRKCKRNPVIASLATVIAGLLMALAVGGPLFAFMEASLREEADKSRQSEAIQRRHAQTLAVAAETARLDANRQKIVAERSAEDANRQTEIAETSLRRVEWLLYASQIASAVREWETGNGPGAWNYLTRCRPDFRGWEHDYLYTLFIENFVTLTGGHDAPVISVAFSPNGDKIVSGSLDKSIRVWDSSVWNSSDSTAYSHRIAEVFGVSRAEFSPDGTQIATCGPSAKDLRVRNSTSGETVHVLRGHTGGVISLAFSPVGRRIVSGSGDETIRMWDAKTGQLIWHARHDSPVFAVDVGPDGNRIASGGEDGTLKVWDAVDGKEILTVRAFSQRASSIAFSPDGNRIVGGCMDNSIGVWNATTGKEQLTLEGHTHPVTSVSFSPNGDQIVSGSIDRSIRVWDATNGKQLRRFTGHTEAVFSVAFSPEGDRLISSGSDKTIRYWNPASRQKAVTLAERFAVPKVGLSTDGRYIVGVSDLSLIRGWDGATLQEIEELKNDVREWDRRITCVAVSQRGRIATGSSESTVRVWDATTREETLTLRGHTDLVSTIAFSPDGERLVSASFDQTLRIWDATTGEETMTLEGHTGRVSTVAFSPDGSRLVSGGSDGTLRVWDPTTGEETLTLDGQTEIVTSVSFSPDGIRLISGGVDGAVRVWELESGRELLVLEGHASWVNCVAVSPDGKRIVSGGRDATLKIWDSTSGQETLTLSEHADSVSSVAFTHDGKRIVSSSRDNTIKVWFATHSYQNSTGGKGGSR